MSHRFASVFCRLGALLLAVAAVFSPAPQACAQTLAFTPGMASTYAGDTTGKLGASAADYTGPVSGLAMTAVGDIVYDSAGNLYIVDEGEDVVRVIAASSKPIPAMPGIAVQAGNVYTLAGGANNVCSADSGSGSGDGCPATQAILGQPTNIAVDAQGNVFLSDQCAGNQCVGAIRVVYAAGSIPQLTAQSTSPVAGSIYSFAAVTNYFNDIPGGDVPGGLAVDAQENIYFIGAYGSGLGVVYSGQTSPGNPFGITNTTAGNIYPIQTADCTYTNTSDACGDGGPFAQAGFSNAGGFAFDSSGNVYITDTGNSRIRVVYVAGSVPGLTNPTPGDIYTVAGGGSLNAVASGSGPSPIALGAPATSVAIPYGLVGNRVAFDAIGNIYFMAGIQVEKVDLSGILTPVFGFSFVKATVCAAHTDTFGDGCPATSANLQSLLAIAVDPGGDIYVANRQATIRRALIRKSTVATSALGFSGTIGLPIAGNGAYLISNTGAQPLQLSALSFTGPFAQTPSGGSNDCTASTSLAPGAACAVAIAFNGATPGQVTGALDVASNSLNATGGNNTLALSATIAQATTATTISVSPTPPTVLNNSQTATFTATVTPQFGDTLTPTGTVTLFSGSTQVGTGTLTNGVATVQVSNLPAGNLQITAQYNGDTNFTGSTSSYVPVNVASVSAPVANVSLAASTTIATIGQSITLTATVTTPGGSPVTSGTVTFQEGDNPLGAAVAVNGSGMATFTTSTLPIGGNPLIAVFSGTTGFGANTSVPVTVTVNGGGELSFTPGVIEKIAGVYPTITNGQYDLPNPGYAGDGGLAVNATLGDPRSAAADSFGNVYIADSGNSVIRVIASGKGTIAGIPNAQAGNIYTFAGGGKCSPAPCGDGVQATQAAFSGPGNIAVDVYGNVYVTDHGNGGGDSAVVRRINPQGIIQTVAGNLGSGPGYGGDNGPATSAQISVDGIFADNAGNLYLADSGNNLVRRVDALTGIITTVAGTASTAGQTNNLGYGLNICSTAPCGDGQPATLALLSSPGGVALDAAGNLYIADTSDQTIRRVDAKTGIISTVAGSYVSPGAYGGFNGSYSGDGGPATSAQLNNPTTVDLDNAGNLYILDAVNQRVRVVNAQTGTINTIVGGGSCTPSSGPCGDGGLATNAQLDDELGAMDLDSQGNLYITHSHLNLIREVPVTTTAINFGSENEGTNNTQTFTVTNIGAQPLNFSGISVANTSPTPGPSPSDFSQQPSGGADCTSNISLAAGETCNIEVQWFPTIQGAEAAAITVASNADNAVSGNNVITAGGSGIAIGGNTAQTITFPALPASVIYGQTIPLNATASSGLPISYRVSGPGTVNQTAGTLTVTGSGAITITAYQFGEDQNGNSTLYAAAKPVSQTTTSTGGPTLTIAANNISVPQGSAIPALTYTINGLVNGDTTSGTPVLTTAGTQNSPIGNYPISIAQGSLTAPAAYDLSFVPGTLYITGTGSQTISFGPVGSVTYGAKPITLGATASSKLPVTFTVASGPGFITSSNMLTITGAGSIVVNANQYGNGTYAAAPVVSQTITVNQAPLT
ncbi:Ig-like domain repeat protein, partial [Paracidobacterium acidisoli]